MLPYLNARTNSIKTTMTKRSMTTRSMATKYPPRKTEFDIQGNQIPMKSFKERNISIAQAWDESFYEPSLLEQDAIKRLIEDFT
jgi:hypothetical protein